MVPTVHGMVLQCNIYGFAKYCKNCFHLEVPHTYLAKKSAIRNLDAGKGAVVSSSCYPTPTHFHFSVRFIYLTGVSVFALIINTKHITISKLKGCTYYIYSQDCHLTIAKTLSFLRLQRCTFIEINWNRICLEWNILTNRLDFFLFLSAVTTNFYFATNLLL